MRQRPSDLVSGSVYASAAAETDSNTAYETEEGDSPGSPSRSIVDIGGDAMAPVHHESLWTSPA